MHYIDEMPQEVSEEAPVVVFLHDVPTSSYLWRNVIPHVPHRCIALDLIGMGKSDKPNIGYRVFDYINFFQAFIQTLDLKNIILVMHGWGSLIGFDYAMHHRSRIQGLVFMESYLQPEVPKDSLSLLTQQIYEINKAQQQGKNLFEDTLGFIDTLFSTAELRKLSEEELAHYREPFLDPMHRHLIFQHLEELPVSGNAPFAVRRLIEMYVKKLQFSELPKLLLYAMPGFNTTMEMVAWAKEHLKNLRITDVGEALHYPQESNPDLVGKAIAEWIAKLDLTVPAEIT